jgi:hypothetical protein
MKRPNELTIKLKICDPELKFYVLALEKENLKCAKMVAKLQVENVGYQNTIIALKKAKPEIRINFNDPCQKQNTDR